MAYEFGAKIESGLDGTPVEKTLIKTDIIQHGDTTLKSFLSALGTGQIEFVFTDVIPTSGESQKIYLVPKMSNGEIVAYNQYIWVESLSAIKFVGTTEPNLTNVLNKSMIGDGSDFVLENGKLKVNESIKGTHVLGAWNDTKTLFTLTIGDEIYQLDFTSTMGTPSLIKSINTEDIATIEPNRRYLLAVGVNNVNLLLKSHDTSIVEEYIFELFIGDNVSLDDLNLNFYKNETTKYQEKWLNGKKPKWQNGLHKFELSIIISWNEANICWGEFARVV